ncbi:MAG TPA: hypothetical protein PKE49_09415 [Leptospiraceae bacterium]|nr:hypothetical protein [Leptospiraceae bacterium]
MKKVLLVIFCIAFAITCNPKQPDDSSTLAILAILIATGVIKPARINTPGGTGDPGGGDGLHLLKGSCHLDQSCLVPRLMTDASVECSARGGSYSEEPCDCEATSCDWLN